ncbi:coproporphyrinogen dehydrogenase HemZ [Alkaliphilus oremlandii]|uniref:Coproporphyrinogen dehydrogenase n=1 Tax=Alkaliphilus oremlandii (strain OhILAs) TaxID=350688 RepID=A8MGM8_ALKOO|nr:coproporphyrinogen dehydrogenase HemZ [Alkaliphilus oremlandii]ABW19251.1 Coproporphyrinogen dehydrogenase [Alkaliphilus oremlandii OhILAs]
MIKVICMGHNYEYEINELLKLFYKQSAFEIISMNSEEYHKNVEDKNIFTDNWIVTIVNLEENQVVVSSRLNGKQEMFEAHLEHLKDRELSKKIKRTLKKAIFKILKDATNAEVPWGILTGIRPTKIVHELIEHGFQEDSIRKILVEEYYIDAQKAALLIDVARTEHRFVYPIDEKKVSLYISIPFCPTRCLYCSFPSNPMKQSAHLVDVYVNSLCKEIEGVGNLVKEAGKYVQTIYIGGGTPTTLNVPQFARIFDAIKKNMDMNSIEEFTVEAGRPDTIDYEKLKFLKDSDVTRLSINPQTMNECTLREIGREHSVGEVMVAYHMAKEVGFENINMDIIIGLPGEDEAMVAHTMREIERLAPNNLTVHTLAIKRASRLKEQEETYSLAKDQEAISMLEITQQYAENMGLKPYYMYRQKHMVGNLENIGYGKPGSECIYNIQIMEEKQTILGLGAGATSKFTFPKENRLERVPNVKNLEQYISRVDEMIERKRKFLVDNI